jgi:hypothetical protein
MEQWPEELGIADGDRPDGFYIDPDELPVV